MSYELSFEPGKVSVKIKRKKTFSSVVKLIVPLVLALVIVQDFAGRLHNSVSELMVYLLVLGPVSFSLLQSLMGHEVLEFTPSTLVQKRTLFGIHSTRLLSMRAIENPMFRNSNRMSSGALGRRGRAIPSAICFSYKGSERTIGTGLGGREAETIIHSAVAHLPELHRIWGSYKPGLPELDEDLSLSLR